MIHVEGLTKHYGERVLFDDVSWHVKKRDRIGLSGPNGAGLPPLVNGLPGLYIPPDGEVRYKGQVLPPKSFKVTAGHIYIIKHRIAAMLKAETERFETEMI